MAFFGKYIRKYWKLFFVAIVFLTLEAAADLLLPTILANIIDEGVAVKRMDVVLRLGGVMLLITAAGALGACVRNIIASRVSQQFGAELRSDLFRKIQSLSFQNLDKFERASLITRLTNDVSQVQNFVNGMMRIFAKAPILAVGSLIMAVRLNLGLASILAVAVPIVAALIAINLHIGFPRFMKVQEALDRVNRVIREYLSGVRVVKAFNRFDYEVDKFNGTNKAFQKQSIQVMRLMSIFNPAIMLTVNFGIIAVIWIGGLWVNEGRLQVGVIVAFINYMTQVLFSLMMISMVFVMFVRARASASRIGEVFAEKLSMTWNEGILPKEDEDVKGLIEFDNVTFSYQAGGGTPVLKNISFTCKSGTTVGIIGSTGSGKTSLVSLIPRFYDCVSGAVKVAGVDVKTTDPQKLREKIAIVPQKSILFSGSIIDNIRWGKENASMEEIEEAARLAEAHDFIRSLPEGYDTILGQRGVNLSGGQKQRISIARALVRQPDILILDDCTSAVDIATEARIKEGLKRAAKNLTCVMIAQRITSVMDADSIIVLDEGEIVGTGTHSELLQHCQVYKEIYDSQVGKEVRAGGGAAS
ncbi:ABC transporter ATP-binding protein [Paenibacillus thermotolerans]|uniref:ABC transporter ATP-binding protein n=1 Tax=Paenibacillus thermotolerans TaxID=3027807 RepID=UPI002368D9C6|nr:MULTISPECIES: ABC transporter ATP-binding protein [unclassified Paenibacillus]